MMADLGVTGELVRQAQQSRHKALFGYLPVGFPNTVTTLRAGNLLAKNVDLLLLGHPSIEVSCSSNRVGRAVSRACASGIDEQVLFNTAEQLSSQVPVIVVVNWADVLRLGATTYCRELASAGVSGIMTPDLAPEHAEQWIRVTDRYDLDRILAALPHHTDQQLSNIAQYSRGWVYVPAFGEKSDISAAMRTLERYQELSSTKPILATDITADTLEAMGDYVMFADALIAGTILVEALPDHVTDGLDLMASLLKVLVTGVTR
ncbi:MAG: tryptophan synthase subunit alpha [Propionibacteriaceae bacterium]